MLPRVILLLVIHFVLCQTEKVFHYERNIEIIEHADIQSLFDLIDEISQYTSSLADQKNMLMSMSVQKPRDFITLTPHMWTQLKPWTIWTKNKDDTKNMDIKTHIWSRQTCP